MLAMRMADGSLVCVFICFIIFVGWYLRNQRSSGLRKYKQIRIAGSLLTTSYNDLQQQGFEEILCKDVIIMAKGKDAYILIDFDEEEEKWCKIDSFEEGDG